MSERGRDYFIMTLSRDLGMTRRQLLNSLDSYELSMWAAFYKEAAKPQHKKKQNPEQLKEGLLSAFKMTKKYKPRKKK